MNEAARTKSDRKTAALQDEAVAITDEMQRRTTGAVQGPVTRLTAEEAIAHLQDEAARGQTAAEAAQDPQRVAVHAQASHLAGVLGDLRNYLLTPQAQRTLGPSSRTARPLVPRGSTPRCEITAIRGWRHLCTAIGSPTRRCSITTPSCRTSTPS